MVLNQKKTYKEEQNRYYEIEELLPVAAKLVRKYTSGESTSVTYDTAEKLMEAVLYCIRECYEQPGSGIVNTLVSEQSILAAETAYQTGYDEVVSKVKEAKEIYNRLVEGFEDYGCVSYHDTILNGMPQFFVRYDARFCPQDHLLTLDYPNLVPVMEACGIDLIYLYLKNLEQECDFLKIFDRQSVISLLESVMPDYRELYLDNICYAVLRQSVCCVIADRPVLRLELLNEDVGSIREYFDSDNLDKIEEKTSHLIRLIDERLCGGRHLPYFMGVSRELAVRFLETGK